jgi:hypothetical protein
MSRRSAHHYVGEWHVIRIERLALLYSMIWNVTGEGLPATVPACFPLSWHGKDVLMTERALAALGAFRLPYWDANDFG